MKASQRTFFFIIAIIISIFLLKTHTHKCRHSDIQHDVIQEGGDYQGEQNKNRNLLIANPQPIRITFGTQELDKISGSLQFLRDYINKLLDTSTHYFYDQLLTQRQINPLKWNTQHKNCGWYQSFPGEIIYQGVESDLHIFVSWEYNKQESYLAYASPCIINYKYRPIFGAINFNLAYMEKINPSDNLEFISQLDTTLHEITHVLGFSGFMMKYWINPETGKNYGNNIPVSTELIRGYYTQWLTTPKVKEVAKNHFGCDEIKGAQLENQGDTGSAGSHWERTTLFNDFMTASAMSIDIVYTQFTFALLEDTGYYIPTYKNMDHLKWGKNKGCDFLKSCDGSKYEEFKTSSTDQCDFYNHGYGYKLTDKFSDQCSYTTIYSNGLCYDERNYKPEYYKNGSYFGNGSRCFQSDVFKKDDNTNYYDDVRCHKYICKENRIFIIIKDEEYECNQENYSCSIFIKGNNNDLVGTVVIPKDQKEFCQDTIRPCKNFCKQNGYCQGNKCTCIKDFAGEDCGVLCENGGYLQNGTCVNKCSDGYILDPDTKVCLQCHSSCKKCEKTVYNCIECTSDMVKPPECVCNAGSYMTKNYECKTCKNVCKTCDSETQCLTCIDDINRQSSPQCDCIPGYYVTSDGLCKKCDDLCKQCSESADKCTQCQSEQRNPSNGCKCSEGYIEEENTSNCIKCSHQCLSCEKQATQCIKCANSTRKNPPNCECENGLQEENNNPICLKCSHKCLECSSQNFSQCTICSSLSTRYSEPNCECISTYYDDGINSECKKCPQKCKTCKNDQECIECANDNQRKQAPSCECLDGYFDLQDPISKVFFLPKV